MKHAIACALLLSSCALAQNIPDTPQPVPVGVRFSDYATPQMCQHSPRGRKKLLALAGVVGFDTLAGLYDAQQTVKGLKDSDGYIEGSPWLIGTHPSFRAAEGRNVLIIGLTATPSLLAWTWRKTPLYYAFLVAPVGDGIKHIQGGHSWAELTGGRRSSKCRRSVTFAKVAVR